MATKPKTKRHASALKAHRQSLKKKAYNYQVRNEVRTLTSRAIKALQEKKWEDAKNAVQTAQSAWQRAARRGIFSRNAASRRISLLTHRLSLLQK